MCFFPSGGEPAADRDAVGPVGDPEEGLPAVHERAAVPHARADLQPAPHRLRAGAAQGTPHTHTHTRTGPLYI